MTRRTIAELIAQANRVIPDSRSVTLPGAPLSLRDMIIDFLDTVTPMYGGLTTVSKAVTLSTTPQALTFDSVLASYPPEWVAAPAQGTLTRTRGALAAITSRFTVSGFIEGTKDTEFRIQLYKNGAPTSWIMEDTIRDPTHSVGFNLVAIDYATEDCEYKLMITATGPAGAATFRDAMFIGENIPVREAVPGALYA